MDSHLKFVFFYRGRPVKEIYAIDKSYD